MEKEIAGKKLLERIKSISSNEVTDIGEYRGFKLQVFYDGVFNQYRMNISNKYHYQNDKAKLGTMKVMLNNASTDFVYASSRYNSRILESQMKAFVDSMGLDLNLSEEPPYKLTEK